MEQLNLAIGGPVIEQSYELRHGTLEFIATVTEVENCWEVCDEMLGAVREQKTSLLETADVGAMKKVSNQFGEDKCTFVFVV